MAVNMTVRVTVDGDKARLTSPYHPSLPARARALGGKWDGKQWVFDARDEQRVRELALAVYGTDGSEAAQAQALVTLLVDMEQAAGTANALWLAGREIASRPDRDGAVRLGDGVTLVAGRFASSGGSMRYPKLSPMPGTVLRVRDVPEAAARDALGGGVSIEQAPDERETRRAALADRRAALLAELQGIEAELVQLAEVR